VRLRSRATARWSLSSPSSVVWQLRVRLCSDAEMSSIVSLLDPNTPDNKVITLQNGVILQPFIHDVKRQKMYGGGACGHLTDPLSVWMKMERCTFLVGCTSNYNAYDRDNSDNDSDISNETTNDGGDNDNCNDLNGNQPRQGKIYRL
jgi:hypothetical protein